MDLAKNVHNYLSTINVIRYLIKINKTEKRTMNVTLKSTGEEYILGQQKVIRLCGNCISDEHVVTQR